MINSTVERLLSLLKWSPSTDTKVFASILLPGLCSNTDTFLALYRSGVFQTSSPLAAVSRFAVKSVTLHNITGNVGLEDEYLGYLSVRVHDLEQRKPYDFIIERTSTESPDNRFLSRIPSLPIPSSSYLSLTPALSPSPTRSQHTGLDSASLTSVQGAHALARSRESLAKVDVILGAGYMRKMRYRSTRVVRKVTPGKLTLFELALLTDVVHNVAAINSLFENHCYWFMKIICDAIVALSDGNYTDDDQDNDINKQPYRSPPNCPSSPHETWNLVSDVRDRVLVDVLSNFSKRRDEEMTKVHFLNSAFSVVTHKIS
jgi:hypothetical protein